MFRKVFEMVFKEVVGLETCRVDMDKSAHDTWRVVAALGAYPHVMLKRIAALGSYPHVMLKRIAALGAHPHVMLK